MRNKEFSVFIKLFILGLMLFFVYMIIPYLDVFAYAIAFSYMALPIYKFLRKFFSSSVSSFLAIALFIVPLILIFIYSISVLIKLILSLDINYYINLLLKYNINLEYLSKLLPEYFKYINTYLSSLISSIPEKILYLSDLALKLIMVVFCTYYFLKDGEKIKDVILKITPTEYEYKVEILLKYLHEIYKSLFISCLFLSVIIGFLAFIIYYLFSIPYPELLAVLTAIFAFLPIIGAWIIYLPASLYIALANPIKGLFFLILCIVFLNIIPDYILRPHIVSTDIHPILVVIAFLIAPLTLGLAGFAIGPLIVGFLNAFYLAKYRDKKI
ncbi:protein of unknown function UPF0118 [Methanocaldococcus infernus ME]|uniref:AI-2E family transporter n=1 Tax=Methanocaldococcus infernus (strain DSM 11812 / JCM 15783 / ME) TaxID=573063 RepID=D5VUA9_METIM|nr:AI-2E family transporter [Methanocaldococcus infernus]ADG12721.1 protein of unknown function UPF0118 [Methanocaldococcus infernus ME]